MNALGNWFRRLVSDPQLVLLLVVVAAAVVIVTTFASMLAPAIAAIVIAFLLDGPVKWLQRHGFGPWSSLLTVYLSFIAGAVLVIFLIVPPLASQISSVVNDSPAILKGVRDGLLNFQERFPDLVSREQVVEFVNHITNEVANFGPRLLEYGLTGLTGAMTMAVYFILVPLMVFFFLKDKRLILGWAASFLPTHKPLVDQVWREVVQKAGDYARGKFYEILIFASASFVAYTIIDLQYATLLAVITGLSVLIPYIGAAVTTLPIALVAYFQWGWSPDLGVAVGLYLVLQAIDGNILAPLLFSEVVKLHPNAIIVAILVFGGIWGFWGVFFAIPLATVANAVVRAWRDSLANGKIEPLEDCSSSEA